MGEYAGELPRKFISFHCLENESNVLRDRNTEGTENNPDFPHWSQSEIAKKIVNINNHHPHVHFINNKNNSLVLTLWK